MDSSKLQDMCKLSVEGILNFTNQFLEKWPQSWYGFRQFINFLAQISIVVQRIGGGGMWNIIIYNHKQDA
jgi:hypothetical protein